MGSKKIKNKDFLKWSRAESCFRKDNIISTDWHERLEKMEPFVPSYSKCRADMNLLLSMEYARMWQKEKEDWYSQIFQAQPKQANLNNRKRKLRQEFLEAKRQAAIKIKERKERLAREAEEKAKAEAEAQEKARRIKAKLEKCAVKKKPKTKKKELQKETKTNDATEQTNGCPKGWMPVELTIQYECAETQTEKEAAQEQQETVEKKQPEPESDSCDQKCILNQIANAVEKLQEKEVGDCINESQDAG